MWPEVFRGREIFLRIDPGFGRGHHSHVRTGGVHSKFGVALSSADELVALTKDAGVGVTGLHAHTGSGIFDLANWTETGAMLADLSARLPVVTASAPTHRPVAPIPPAPAVTLSDKLDTT